MNLDKLREVGKQARGQKWYKAFCKQFDTDYKESARWLKACAEFKPHIKHTGYYPGKSGPGFRDIELFTLRFPEELNECEVCGKSTKWAPNDHAWRKTCSVKCAAIECVPKRESTSNARYGVNNPSQAESVKRKRVKTFIKRFGVDNPRKAKSVKRKIVHTVRERYGVDNASQSEAVKAKKRETSIKRFGHEHWTKSPKHFAQMGQPWDEKRLAKARATCLRLYGVDNPWKLESVQEQIRLKHFEKYGANPGAVFNGYARRIIEDRFGVRHIVQGYEDFAVQYFSKQKSVVKIVTQTRQLPRFRYTGIDKKLHNYHPDLKVVTSSTMHIIEVKSEWTLNMDLDKNIRKFRVASRSCLRKGFNFWVFVFHRGKVLKVKNPKTVQDLEDAGLPVRRPLE